MKRDKSSSNHLFTPYSPDYSLREKLQRTATILHASAFAVTRLLQNKKIQFAASVEITDRCNAGCHYCYVYPQEWDQRQRLQGYLQLSKAEHSEKERQVFQTLDQLKQAGIIHVTLVGGEPALAPHIIQYAANLFPIIWVVTNGAARLPLLPRSVSAFVSLDGPPDHHNQSRDPMGFFANHHYEGNTGMAAAIARNINQSERGAFVHLTLTRPAVERFPEAVSWVVRTVTKLRGIIVSGTTAKTKDDPAAFTLEDRQRLKQLIEAAAQTYGWSLFPFNQPKANEFLFNAEHIIDTPSNCLVSQLTKTVDFDGRAVGKCVLRDEMDCQTCLCNMTALTQAIAQFDVKTIRGVSRANFG
ncbi:MAG: radical SAM protein [Myxacorys californica WJT36-NPBG1]|nr:radical SAM protein [Myxacorys californica WJT36-NPBG1]